MNPNERYKPGFGRMRQKLVDEAFAVMHEKRKTRGVMTTGFAVEAAEQLPWSNHYQKLVARHLGMFRPDRDVLIARMEKWRGNEQHMNLGDVAVELQDLAKEDLREQLVNDGLPPGDVDKVVKVYSFGVLLQ